MRVIRGLTVHSAVTVITDNYVLLEIIELYICSIIIPTSVGTNPSPPYAQSAQCAGTTQA